MTTMTLKQSLLFAALMFLCIGMVKADRVDNLFLQSVDKRCKWQANKFAAGVVVAMRGWDVTEYVNARMNEDRERVENFTEWTKREFDYIHNIVEKGYAVAMTEKARRIQAGESGILPDQFVDFAQAVYEDECKTERRI